MVKNDNVALFCKMWYYFVKHQYKGSNSKFCVNLDASLRYFSGTSVENHSARNFGKLTWDKLVQIQLTNSEDFL